MQKERLVHLHVSKFTAILGIRIHFCSYMCLYQPCYCFVCCMYLSTCMLVSQMFYNFFIWCMRSTRLFDDRVRRQKFVRRLYNSGLLKLTRFSFKMGMSSRVVALGLEIGLFVGYVLPINCLLTSFHLV